MRDTHPFQGLGMTGDRAIGFWEDCSSTYSAVHQGDIPDRIVSRLHELGMIGKGKRVLEIGSGPGTYSIRMARLAGSVTCLDSSPGMLSRLMGNASEAGLDNIVPLLCDWNLYEPEPHDLCISTLAPTGSPESIMRMESSSEGWCASVSWITNEGDELTARIWEALGKDYGFDARRSSPTFDWLLDNGRNPVMETMETRVRIEILMESLIEKERVAFRAYGVSEDVGPIVEELMSPHEKDGIVSTDERNSMRLIYWKSVE